VFNQTIAYRDKKVVGDNIAFFIAASVGIEFYYNTLFYLSR
jgi:hypothetical protein